jgi:hypothetical protein
MHVKSTFCVVKLNKVKPECNMAMPPSPSSKADDDKENFQFAITRLRPHEGSQA